MSSPQVTKRDLLEAVANFQFQVAQSNRSSPFTKRHAIRGLAVIINRHVRDTATGSRLVAELGDEPSPDDSDIYHLHPDDSLQRVKLVLLAVLIEVCYKWLRQLPEE